MPALKSSPVVTRASGRFPNCRRSPGLHVLAARLRASFLARCAGDIQRQFINQIRFIKQKLAIIG